MTSNESPASVPMKPDDSAQIKRKLAWRMGIAGLMIVALLGGLALFDRLAAGPDETEPAPPRFTEPVPVPKKSATQALGTVVPAPGEGTEKPGASVPESTEAPTGRSAALPPVREGAANPAAGHVRQAAHAAPSAGRGEQRGNQATAAGTPASTPEAPAANAPAGPAQPAVAPRPLSGYTLQAGIFADPRRAEDVLARLAQEGIPATLETRVLVGPFRNRGEAESARATMRMMGIDAAPAQRSGKK